MNAREARAIAEALVEEMRPFCERIEIGGSLRRQAREVKDIELVAIPKMERVEFTPNLFGESEVREISLLHAWAKMCWDDKIAAPDRASIQWIKPSTSEISPWEPKSEAKYLRAMATGWFDQERRALGGPVALPIKLDLFITTPASWGVIFLIRTGSAEFSQAVVTHARRCEMFVSGGVLHDAHGIALETREERDVFELLGLEWAEPVLRRGAFDVRPIRKAVAS